MFHGLCLRETGDDGGLSTAGSASLGPSRLSAHGGACGEPLMGTKEGELPVSNGAGNSAASRAYAKGWCLRLRELARFPASETAVFLRRGEPLAKGGRLGF